MTQLPQNKRGYIRGVRGLIVTRINSDGTDDAGATPYVMSTPQQIAIEAQVVSGEESILRGGDKLLARVKDPDIVVGVNLGLQDARIDAQGIETLAGGTLVEVIENGDTRIVGWEAPTVEAQNDPPYFKAEAYAASFKARGVVEGYIKYTFFYCRAAFGNETLQDQQWLIPELNIEVTENPALTGGVYRKEFVDSLPAELA